MKRMRQRKARILSAGIFLCAWCVLNPAWVLGQTGVQVVLEPGFPLADGRWLVPVGLVDGQGTALEVPGDEIQPAIGDRPVPGFDLGLFAPEPGGFPSSVAVLVDGEFPASGNEDLAGFLGRVNRSGRKGLFLCADDFEKLQGFGGDPLPAARLAARLGQDDAGRLWDNVLAAIGLLAGEGDARKVLLVVSSGKEDLASQHPLASCVEGALRARVAVHFLELPGYSAGAARLRELARKTGGVTTPYSGKNSMKRALSVIEQIQALTVSVDAQPLPADLTVGFGFSEKAVGTVSVARPKALSGPALWLVVLLAAGVLAVVAIGFFLYKWVTRISGALVLETPQGQKVTPIPRAGVTVGSDPDNVLVLDDSRIGRHHAVIREKGGEVIVTDLRSKTGTMVNGHPIRNTGLRDGDRVILGKAVEMIFRRELNSKRKE